MRISILALRHAAQHLEVQYHPRMPVDNPDPQATARLELHALERMIAALCRHTARLAREAGHRGELDSREADLQLQAFAERRAQALELLKAPSSEPCEIRIARLERLVEALDQSREFFRPAEADAR
ncbi:MAG TPA: hypothetical protein VF329_11660 [Gammaproteobacteria bacterium]